ncbi:hypothetical protein BU23DRAFT_645531 [Bimuria novae-zelandiae CBS 107.79]|uniref:Uncharacterized protein n=1 Tax=Bimuria novae-zelandiae CBS 107.79 TaxID=1447943 RepID=A0A6A5V3W3_9PLEO|nr:hypothetical protein BU23DRAFT_645531 [Bimuria novae-zelandiae CBS 107.79]
MSLWQRSGISSISSLISLIEISSHICRSISLRCFVVPSQGVSPSHGLWRRLLAFSLRMSQHPSVGLRSGDLPRCIRSRTP